MFLTLEMIRSPGMQILLAAHLAKQERSAREPYATLRKAAKACRSRVQLAFKSQGARMSASTSKLIGCTWSELKAHIESQFLPGMNWVERKLWHIDHIKPIARFNLTDPAQVAECFNYKNLQPLWGPDNIRKSDKYEEPATATP